MGHCDSSAPIGVFSWFDDPVILIGLLQYFHDGVVEIIEFKALWDYMKDISVISKQISCEIGQ